MQLIFILIIQTLWQTVGLSLLYVFIWASDFLQFLFCCMARSSQIINYEQEEVNRQEEEI